MGASPLPRIWRKPLRYSMRSSQKSKNALRSVRGSDSNRSLNNRLTSLATKAGLDWLAISAGAVEVVVFGSRAVRINTRASDLDVLVVGANDGRIKRSGLDLVAVSARRRESSEWLKSE